MITNGLKYIVISDIHLGNKRNKTKDILNALYAFFEPYTARDDIDIIFLAGDVFDGLLDLSDEAVYDISLWMRWLIRYCARCDVKLRILEGTPRHDRQQSRLFEIVKTVDSSASGADVLYVKTLNIEYIRDYDIYVLYVPDEWNSSTDKTLSQVKQLMSSIGIDKVDISIMHGMFGYQVPKGVTTIPTHSEIEYLGLTRYYIHIGHDHTFSMYERIIVNGSFDRLCHGEENPKGGVEISIRKDGSSEFWFIENKLAKKFITLVINSRDIESIIKYIQRKVKNLPADSYLRIKAKRDHPALLGIEQIKSYFPLLNITKMPVDEEDDDEYQLMSDVMTVEATFYAPITITRDNINDLLFDEIRQNHNWSNDQWCIASKELSELD